MKESARARFIPAGAGNTPAEPAAAPQVAVYPRWRGEHRFIPVRDVSGVGLSPLARGTRALRITRVSKPRFIPAGAGNTVQFSGFSISRQVYPRWRGEHMPSYSRLLRSVGLSPLARGTLRHRQPQHEEHRFIPAGAGNTFIPSHAHKARSVYPRWRGEHFPAPARYSSSPGLSPLARGTHFSSCVVSE